MRASRGRLCCLAARLGARTRGRARPRRRGGRFYPAAAPLEIRVVAGQRDRNRRVRRVKMYKYLSNNHPKRQSPASVV
jgi:hypothetical protein